MFWGLVLEPSKKYTQKVDQTFHISQAALDFKSSDQEPIQLVVEYENSNFILATLSKKANIFQVPLDLIFKTGDQVSFRTIGNGKVHLSGYHVLDDIDSMLNGEDESDLEEMEELEEAKGKRKKPTPNSKNNKKIKLKEEESEDEFEEDEDDEEEDTDDENVSTKKKLFTSSSMNDEDEDDDDDEDIEEEEEDDEDGDDDDSDEDLEMEEEDDDDDDEELVFDEDEEEVKTRKSQSKKSNQTPNGTPNNLNMKNKLNKKLNQSKEQTPGKQEKTPGKGEKQGKNINNQSTPQRKNQEGMKGGDKTPKSPKGEGSAQKKVLEGGVISEDIRVGDGPVAKPGKMVNVYYVGTLGSSKKQFDSVQQGPGFKFRLGRNEVIKGWDIGVNGMKVGGKRRLTIPAHLAYGSKGSPPVIPPNSTLIFTVELKGLS